MRVREIGKALGSRDEAVQVFIRNSYHYQCISLSAVGSVAHNYKLKPHEFLLQSLSACSLFGGEDRQYHQVPARYLAIDSTRFVNQRIRTFHVVFLCCTFQSASLPFFRHFFSRQYSAFVENHRHQSTFKMAILKL